MENALVWSNQAVSEQQQHEQRIPFPSQASKSRKDQQYLNFTAAAGWIKVRQPSWLSSTIS